MNQSADGTRRTPLSRERVLRAAVAFADGAGTDAISMRKLAQELGVVPMALYKHVANKDELLDGMVDLVVGEIGPPGAGEWRLTMRAHILAARRVLLRHPWAAGVIQSRTSPTPAVLGHLDSMARLFRTGGFSVALTHHAMHAMGSRLLGFSQELFDDTAADPDPALLQQLARAYPHIAELAGAVGHDAASTVGNCDDQAEFEFALDLLLDGLDRLRSAEGSGHDT